LPYTKDDLKILFGLDMPEHCRSVMQIMLMTGMRPDEAASLTWEQFNNTNYGFRYFALFDDTSTQDINVKNEQSKRLVPLHPQLVLPPKGEGYLFNFREAEGKRVTGMGQELKPFYDVIGHSRKRSHSFRRTLKIMLRDAVYPKKLTMQLQVMTLVIHLVKAMVVPVLKQDLKHYPNLTLALFFKYLFLLSKVIH